MNSIQYGVFTDMPAEVYHALPGASASILRKFHNSTPAHAKVEIEKPREPSVEMIMGTLAHHYLLEPEKPSPKLAIQPKQYPAPANSSLVKTKKVAVGDPVNWSYNANYCIDWKREQERAGRIVQTEEAYENTIGMVKSILLHPVASQYFTEGQAEVSIVSYSKDAGIPVRARLDWVPRGRTIVDVKTSHDASPSGFEKTAFNAGYHVQAFLYQSLWNAMCGSDEPKDEFVFVVVESAPPFAVNVFKCSTEFMNRGQADFMKYIMIYAECLKTNQWPAYSTESKTLELPKWASEV